MFFASVLAWFLLHWKEHFCQLHHVVVLPGATHVLEEISGWVWHVGNRGRCLNSGKRYKVSHLCYCGDVIQQIDKQVTLPQETTRKYSLSAWFSSKTSWHVLELLSILSAHPSTGFSFSHLMLCQGSLPSHTCHTVLQSDGCGVSQGPLVKTTQELLGVTQHCS